MNSLQTAVIQQLGYDEMDDECMDTLKDVSNYGADGGFGQFCYYSDTTAFFDDHRTEILTEINELSGELGESAADIVKGFNCLNHDFDHEVDQVLLNLPCEDDVNVKNALAWFALEHVAFQLTN